MTDQPGSELDELTLVRAQRGEEAACTALLLRYQAPVFALVSRIAGQGPWVEDLAQEAFLRAFRALASFDRRGPARLSTWLLTIATRLCLDELRRRRPQSEPLEAHSERLAAPERSDAGLLHPGLRRALETLLPEQRAVLVLREVHGFSTAEAAAALGIEEGTVKSRLSRAKATLRAALEDANV